MKKIVLSILATLVLSLTAFADGRYIDPSQLPAQAKSFITEYFPNVSIAYAEADWDSFDVHLENGVEIDFRKNGEWETVDAGYSSPLPTGFIPPAVLTSIQREFPAAAIIEIDKEWGGFDIKLDNWMEIKMSADGQIFRREYDD